MSAATRRLLGIRAYRQMDAKRDLDRAVAGFGEDHPAARAALGRFLAHTGWVPQRGLATPEAIAWYRETGSDPGHMNRTARANDLDLHIAALTTNVESEGENDG